MTRKAQARTAHTKTSGAKGGRADSWRAGSVLDLGSREERIAWYALLALPVAVPIILGVVPFSSAPFTQNPAIYPKTLVLALIVAVASAALAYGVWKGTIALRTVPGRWLLLAFLGLLALSTLFAMSPTWAFFGGEFLRVGALVMLLCAAVYVLATQLITTPQRMRALSWATVGGGMVVAIVAFLQTRGIDFLATSRDNMVVFLRGPSLLGNPDYTATYLVVILIVAAALALSARDARSRIVAWACSCFVLLTIALSLTRGAWVGAAVGLIALAIPAAKTHISKKSAVLALAGVALIVAVAVAVAGPSEFAKRFEDLSSAETAGDTRLVMWGEALSVIKDRPLLGTGPDSYSLGWYGARSVTSMERTGVNATHGDPHNTVLLLTATLGVPAGLLLVIMVVTALIRTGRTVFARNAKPALLLYSGWWAATLGLCAALLFAPTVSTLMMMLGLVLGVLMAPRATVAEGRPALQRLVVTGMAVGASVLVVLSAITLAADIRLKEASGTGDLAALDAATRLAPWHAEAQYTAALAYVDTALALQREGAVGAEQALDAAEERVDALIDRNPYKYGSYTLKAHLLLQRGANAGSTEFVTRARSAARQALDIYPLSPVAAFYKAQAEALLGEVDAALETLEPLWNIDPVYSDAGILYVKLLTETGRIDEARKALTELKAKHPWDQKVLELETSLEAGAALQ